MNSIELKGISKFFSEKKVLKSIDLHIKHSECFGLLGPSGAGKTTIINILTGQMKQSAGKAHLMGVDSSNLNDEIHSQMGMLLDNSGLYERLSCNDNLQMFCEIYGIKKSEINSVLEKVGLEDCAKKKVSSLSKGMRQRLVLARAIMHNPRLLFLDEPTSGLDPSTMLEIHKLILELKENGTTIFLTTHNMVEASKLCDNVALLNEGKIIEYGKPAEICIKHNLKNKINILLKDGVNVELLNDSSSATIIASYFEKNLVESIHSSEPNLESVFVSMTGRKLVG